MDSDTKVAMLSNSPSVEPQDWFIPQDQVFKTRAAVNEKAGTRRMLAHFTITPGWDGWLDKVDEAIEKYKPDSWKGYTVGDNTHKELAGHPWHADDEKLMYPFYEKIAKTGIRNVCIHKGLFAPAVAEKFPRLLPYADVSDIGRAAKDWPQLNFLVYHSGYRWVGGNPADAMAEFDKTGRSSWTSDLAEIPEKYGVTNVYGDLGQIFAWTAVAAAAPGGGADGDAGQGARARPHRLGHRRGVDRRAAMADRGAAPARNPRGHAEEIRLQAAGPGRRPGQDRDVQRQFRAALWAGAACRAGEARSLRGDEGRVSRQWRRAAAICATAMSRGRREEGSFRADRRLTRRELMTAAVGGLSAALPARAGEPPGKMSQIAAAYQSTPKGLFSCAVCTFFIRPRSCKVVSGDISPTGWCRFFDLPD